MFEPLRQWRHIKWNPDHRPLRAGNGRAMVYFCMDCPWRTGNPGRWDFRTWAKVGPAETPEGTP